MANHLDLSRASVSNAMKKLEQEGKVEMLEDGSLILTKKGRDIGVDIDERHQTLKDWFLHIGVSPATAEDDACKVEHAISKETFECLKHHYKSQMK